jgi:hypothetical protein
MRNVTFCCIAFFSFGTTTAQSPEPPLDEERLTVHTLVREDIFAGWRSSNMDRLERGERNLDRLLETRPKELADLLAWKGGVALFRAVLAHEAGDEDEFREKHLLALDLFDQSRRANPKSPGAASVIGGSYVLFADRLPKEVRQDAWQSSYESYQVLKTLQAKVLSRLPTHMRGELYAGLAQASERTGRTEEFREHLDTIIQVLPETPYSRIATKWKEFPEQAKTGTMACKTCHSPGRLSARQARLEP